MHRSPRTAPSFGSDCPPPPLGARWRACGPSRGFTILETLVAAAILMIVTMAVLQIMPSAALASKHNDNQLAADALAQGKIAALRTVAYSSLADSTEKVTRNGTEFQVEVKVAAPPAALGTTSVRQVLVTVRWEDPGPTTHPCVLQAQMYLGKTR